MKLSTCCAALLLALASPAVLAAPGSCERIQSDISQRIINNGVPESSFTLSIVPNDQVDQWICPYISRHLLSLNPLQARCRRYS
ncbi:DUF1161 domain-containing protein, partial [Shigella flexneri]|uniref:DUF1161 domain-containing protein n=1 Tax=Shigella flexneri TaxID=623 RepID=UPI003CF4B912